MTNGLPTWQQEFLDSLKGQDLESLANIALETAMEQNSERYGAEWCYQAASEALFDLIHKNQLEMSGYWKLRRPSNYRLDDNWPDTQEET